MSYVNNSRFQVQTPNGWCDFSGIKSSKRKGVFDLTFSNNEKLTTTPEHRLKNSNNEFVYVRDLHVGAKLFGDIELKSIEFIDNEIDVFDLINVDNGHEYYTNGIVSSNCAFIRDFADIWTGLCPTLSTGGSAIIISTPNGTTGVGQQYYKMWVETEAGQNDFNPIRLPWEVHPERDLEWFEREKKQLGDPRRVAQELLCDFQASGETFINPNDLEKIREGLVDPVTKDGHVWIWQPPRVGGKYVISADVARGDSADYSAFHVFDYENCEQCAEYLGKLPPDRFGELLLEWGKKYNDALIAPENNSYGYMTCMRIKVAGYQRLYSTQTKGDPFMYVPSEDEVPGFSTNSKTRTQILNKLEETLRNGTCTIYSRRLYEQLHAFVWNNGKAVASADSHDDLVISAAIGAWIALGGDKLVSNDTSLTLALLNSTGKFSNSRADVLSHIDVVGPPGIIAAGATGGLPVKSPYGNMNTRQRNTMNTFDYSWLLR